MTMIKVPTQGNHSFLFTVDRQNDNICSNKTARFFFLPFPRKEEGVRCKMSLAGRGGGGSSAGEDVRTTGSNRDGVGGTSTRRRIVEDYNTAMKRMMRNPYEYHHDIGMNYTHIIENLIVGSQPQKPEDIIHLKKEENVAYILCLQQDSDIEYWGIDLEAIVDKCRDVGIRHMRTPARDFDPDSLRIGLPKAVSALEWAISEAKGKVYVHCTAGLGRAPAVSIAYMFWFCGMNLDSAYDALTSKRSCGPSKKSIRGATYDLAKNDPWKEPFEDLLETAFGNVSDWERSLIQERVRGLRGY